MAEGVNSGLIIREAENIDIPDIVKVLKASLGEEELSLSEDIWNFKHKFNPFGKSLVLVAEENGSIIGVRAFMRWNWNYNGKIFSGFRAVDTATHPEQQGRGIFKKLTLNAVQVSIKSGGNFVFNTPNDKSRPGYLKMGWIDSGKIEVALKPVLKFWNFKNQSSNYEINYHTTSENIIKLCEKWNSRFHDSSCLFTPKSLEYLKWRYENNPLIQYEVYASSDFYLACYVKKQKGIKELRISECIYLSEEKLGLVEKTINLLCKKFGVHIISFSGKLLKLPFPFLKGSFGPKLTVRELNLQPAEKNICFEIDNWCYSLGDLELF